MENSWNGWRWSLWELLVIGDTESQLDTSCKQVRPPVKGVVYIQLSCWPRGSSRNSQTAQAFGKQILLSANWQWAPIAEDDSGVPVLKATPTQLFWPWRSWTDGLRGAFTSMFSSLWCRKVSAAYCKRIVDTNPATKMSQNIGLQFVLPENDARAMETHNMLK